MINTLRLLRNIGRFDSVTSGANLPLAQLTLLYAENGRGKTTLAAILRSLATGDAIPINERRRLAAQHPPHVVVSCTGGPPDAIFQNEAWNRTLPDIVIFDDVFVDENVYSGLVVGSDHRQNLHELILGSQGVALSQKLHALIARVEQHNTELRRLANAIPLSERGTLSVDNFCALAPNQNIDQEIETANQNLAASQQQELIRNTPDFQQLILPEINLEDLQDVFASSLPDIDAAAVARVQKRLQIVGDESEKWVAEGMQRQQALQPDDANECVFCAQDISASPIITHYRAFFSDAYRDLQRDIGRANRHFDHVHSTDVAVSFERAVGAVAQSCLFWAQFTDIPELTIDPAAIRTDWNAACDHVAKLLAQKWSAPFDSMEVSAAARATVDTYEVHRQKIAQLNQKIVATNKTIAAVKQQAATANPAALKATVNRLTAIRARHSQPTDALCAAYLAEKQAKAATEQQRGQARQALEKYRTNVFPAYEAAITRYLQKFNAGYHLDSVTATNTRGGPTCTYNVIVNDTAVAVGGAALQPGQHSFKNVLSAGDRNALALAFFLAALELDPNRASKIVVIDDPVSSLDEHRSLTTIQEIRHLMSQVSQVVILSHNKPFLCQIWENADPALCAAIHVVRSSIDSTLEAWDVSSDCITENDRRHEAMRAYLAVGGQDEREIARSIRPTLEAFFRVAYPEHFTPGTLLGSFRGLCDQRVGTPQEILSQRDINELRNIVEYANQFHHDANPAWKAKGINSTELEKFVQRTVIFAKRP